MAKISALPSRKLFISLLKDCHQVAETSSGRGKIWMLKLCGQKQHFSIVWIQGTVTQCSQDDDNMLYLNDGTGQVAINCATLPNQCVKLTEGQYGMVVGELQQAGETPVIRAMKMQDLGTVPDASALWKMEVIDLNLACLQQTSSQH